ncbi:MAG: tripartite tricarboxylate transporter substrate binding protein BugD [Burkholderiaceae bacterium]|nr:tripartite tricarboxylate transporter substrate binding protein BugD [Burkholderiaceae bacterium]
MPKLLKLTLLAAAVVATGAYAENFPASGKNITIIVPFPAGGPTDNLAHDLANALRKPLGTTPVIENAAGTGSTIGTAKVARAAPDGYTLLLNHIGMSTMPTLYRKLAFSVPNDFEYLGIINDVPMTLVGRPSLEANSYKELSAWLAQNKGKVNLGHAGLGSASHLCGLMYQSALQTNMTVVPYKGTAPAITDLIGGQIDLLCDQTTNTMAQIEAKKVKAYAVTTSQRLNSPSFKGVPTLAESGLKNFQVTIWHGLYAPKGTPVDVLKKINDSLKIALKDPEFVKKQESLGAVVATDKRTDPAEHKKFVQAEIQKWGSVIKAAGAYAD